MPLDEAILDYQILGEATTGEGSGLLRVIVVAAREPMIMRMVDAVRGAGLRPEGIDLSAFALMRVVAPTSEPQPAPARIYCHLAGVTNLAVADEPRRQVGARRLLDDSVRDRHGSNVRAVQVEPDRSPGRRFS